jgi:hypothetical protein
VTSDIPDLAGKPWKAQVTTALTSPDDPSPAPLASHSRAVSLIVDRASPTLTPSLTTLVFFRPVRTSLRFHPEHHRSIRRLRLVVTIDLGACLEGTIDLTTEDGNGELLMRGPTSSVSFEQHDARTGFTVSWEGSSLVSGRTLGIENATEEITRRLRRLEVEARPIWIPDAVSVRGKRKPVRMPDLGPRRQGFDLQVSLSLYSNFFCQARVDETCVTCRASSRLSLDRLSRMRGVTTRSRRLELRWKSLTR